MREPTIAKNYAEALFETGERLGKTELFDDLINALAAVVQIEPTVRAVLESPRVRKEQKQKILRESFRGRAPDEFVRFLDAVIKRGRQSLFGAIAEQYAALVDVKLNRVHVGVTVARKADRKLQSVIQDRLTAAIGKEVIPHFRTDANILGGVILRIGDRIMDGSLRRKMKTLRRQLLRA